MVLITLMFSGLYVIDAPTMLEAIRQSRKKSEADMSDESGEDEREQHTDWWGDPIATGCLLMQNDHELPK